CQPGSGPAARGAPPRGQRPSGNRPAGRPTEPRADEVEPVTTPDNGPVALLVRGALDAQQGAAPMRWRALRAALGDADRPCVVVELTCDHRRACREVCAAAGGPPPNPTAGEWWYTSAYCDHHAALIARRLTAAGVGTVVCSGLDTHAYVAPLAATPGLR